jgi:rhamnosyltransferase
MSDPSVSIIMRSFNEAWALRETLPALGAQNLKEWELIVIDSGSTDGSVELLRRFQLAYLIQIPRRDYNPARVMNCGMELASSNYVLFLDADATPQGRTWIEPLVSALLDPKTAAVYGRQIPRPDCRAVFAHDCERCFAPERESARWDHFFSMASSGVRKDVWERRRFNEMMRYSEDDEFTRWCRGRGYRPAYAPESIAMHSHNYTPSQMWKRSFDEGRALAAVWDSGGETRVWWRSVLLGWMDDARRDLAFCRRTKRLREWPHALGIRWQQRAGRLAGSRSGWDSQRQPQKDSSTRPPAWATDLPR